MSHVSRIVFATSARLPDGDDHDHATAALLGADFRVWSDPAVDWDSYDRVIIRSTWDYTKHLTEFLHWAHRVGPARLRNTPNLIAFNADKRYLADLRVPTIATTFVAPGDPLPTLAGDVVVKPTISAGAVDTGRFDPDHHDAAVALIRRLNDAGRTAIVQPYQNRVDTDGEVALVYLGGQFSHVLQKKPVLRPNEEAPLHVEGGETSSAEAMFDPDLVTLGETGDAHVALGEAALAELSARFGTPLYVRVDTVPGPDGSPVVIELEAVEPCLYLNLAPGSHERFAKAILGA